MGVIGGAFFVMHLASNMPSRSGASGPIRWLIMSRALLIRCLTKIIKAGQAIKKKIDAKNAIFFFVL